MFAPSILVEATQRNRAVPGPSEPSFTSKPARTMHPRWVLLLALAASACLLVINAFHREEYYGDEGFYGVTALNMLHSSGYILRPSCHPAGDFLSDQDAFAHPPFNSYLYAIALWLSGGSLAGVEVLNALSFALLLFFTYLIVRHFDSRAAAFAVLLLAASPSIANAYSQLEAEPLMITFGIIALYCALRGGFSCGQRLALFLSGLCLGFSFALKLWLCGPLALAVLAAIVVRAREADLPCRQKVLPLALWVAGAMLPAALHLLAIASYYPEDLGFWLKKIYFGILTGSGISGGKLSASAVPADWVHPWWYYGPALYRDHFFLAPIILFGARSLFRDRSLNPRFLWIILAGIAGLVPLSLMKVKEPNYVLACAVFLYLLAGACLAAIAPRIGATRSANPLDQIDSFSKRFGTLAIVGLLLVMPLAYLRGIQPGKITAAFVLVHSITLAAFLVILWLASRKGTFAFECSLAAVCTIGLLTAFCGAVVTRQPRDKIISELLRPYIQSNPPNALSLIASDFKSYQFYSFRRGCYWAELPKGAPEAVLNTPKFTQVHAFIIDRDDQQLPAVAPWIEWLETHGKEITPELNTRLRSASGFRLFVR